MVFRSLGRVCRDFVRARSGATGIEYGLLAALLAVAIIASISAVGDNTVSMYQTVADEMNAAGE